MFQVVRYVQETIDVFGVGYRYIKTIIILIVQNQGILILLALSLTFTCIHSLQFNLLFKLLYLNVSCWHFFSSV